MTSKLFLTFLLGTTLTLAALPPSASAQEHAPKHLLAKAKLTRAEAEKIALATVPNATVKEAELEEENGGLRWSFDLQTPRTKNITEVGVDAMTGKVVENKVENARDEAREKQAEKTGSDDKH